jgi:flagellar basal-body rod modification protein FlgD
MTNSSSVTGLDSSTYRVQDELSMFAAPTRSNELGRNEFMQLLVKQLENQNPLEPMKNEEFVAQLATFSSLEQLTDMNKRMDSMISGQGQLINAQALTLIGREVVADTGGTLRMNVDAAGNRSSDRIVVDVAEQPAAMYVEIKDASGKVVRRINVDDPQAGRTNIEWDGLGAGDVKLPAGEYTFDVVVTDGKGNALDASGYVALTVDGINIGDGGLALVSGDRTIDFANVIEIRQAPATTTTGDVTAGGGAAGEFGI